MKPFSIFLLIALLSCQPDDAVVHSGNVQVAAAFIIDNSLLADGCEDYVRLTLNVSDSSGTGNTRKPTPTSLPIYRKALADIPPVANSIERAVTIQFVETGKQVELLCGWGIRPIVKEIDILSISPR